MRPKREASLFTQGAGRSRPYAVSMTEAGLAKDMRARIFSSPSLQAADSSPSDARAPSSRNHPRTLEKSFFFFYL